MTITVKIPRKSKYALPNMCVACGKVGGAQVPIFRYRDQFGSHSIFTFNMCNDCFRYVNDGISSKKKLSHKEFEVLPAEEKKRAHMAMYCVGVKLPFFYLGKVEYSFNNDDYGILFWKLNGGEMSEYHHDLPEFT